MRRTAYVGAAVLSLGALAFSAPTGSSAQSPEADDHPRTTWGEPDLSGVYAEYTTAPLERPEEFGDRELLTDEEFEAVERIRLAGEEVYESVPTGEVHYDLSIYSLNANEGVSSPNRRTSIVVSPKNGRIPPLLAEAAARAQAREDWRMQREFDGPEYRTLQERCIVWSTTLPPILPRGYNSNLQIFQSPGYVLIQGEMGDPRIIPTDGRPLPENSAPQWNGTSVGRWDGDALVVETTGFVESAGYHPYTAWRNAATSNMRVTERFTRIDQDTVEYAFTVEDPETWAEPWSGVYPLTQMDAVLFEYACTEGNYGMANILSGARATEDDVAADPQSVATWNDSTAPAEDDERRERLGGLHARPHRTARRCALPHRNGVTGLCPGARRGRCDPSRRGRRRAGQLDVLRAQL